MDNDDLKIMTNTGLATVGSMPTGSVTIASNAIYNTATISASPYFDVEDFLDQHIMSRVTIDHKIQEQELLKLKEVAPDYANEIKENLSKNAARDIIKKMTFTKKHDKDADVHHFIGRVWVFTEQELKDLLQEVRND